MDEEGTMDFNALRAKFQDEDILNKQPKTKPALPEKPKVIPPPHSPTHYLPAGARPSLISSINQSLEGKTPIIPRVIFKDDQTESKTPLIQTNSKGKNKSQGKVKAGKNKTTKEKLDSDSNPSDQKQKKENAKDKRYTLVLPGAQKESTAELVPATPPPKATTPKKKAFLSLKKSSKKYSVESPPDPILDTPTSDVPGSAPLIPVPSGFQDVFAEPEILTPKALLPNTPSLPESSATVDITPPLSIPEFPNFSPPPAFIPEIPVPNIPTPANETPLETETPDLPIFTPPSPNEIIPNTLTAVSTPPHSHAISNPIPAASTPSPLPPEPEVGAESGVQAVKVAAAATPPPEVKNPQSQSPSPKAQLPMSALSALARADDMSPGKRSHSGDNRIFSALEKARRKANSVPTTPSTSFSATPPPEDLPPHQSPTTSLPELPPIDYEGNPLKPVGSVDHQQSSSPLNDITDGGHDTKPELLVVPPPPPRKVLPDTTSLGPAPQKPSRPQTVDLSEFTSWSPPHVENNEVPVSPEFPETERDVPEFVEVFSDVHSPELQVSQLVNGEYTGPDTTDGQNLPDYYSNGITAQEPEVPAASALGDEYHDNSLLAGSEAEVGNGVYESAENVYEDISTSSTKKKGKTDGGKKRKGPPKNPYAEAAQVTNEEKTKTGRFGKNDKKAAAEGPDEKELKKKEKQRLEKEKKELKEKQEREKKEQKEREKKENEIKKKFKITGQEDALYRANVTVTTKGRKADLPVKSGDVVSIIRTTNCPKGKWLARDSSNNYGYVAVDHVELDIKEMLELGKKTAITRNANNNVVEDVTSTGSRASNHRPLSTDGFSDDSEEWTIDDDEPLSPAPDATDPPAPVGHSRTFSMPDFGNISDLSVNHQHSRSDMSAGGPHVQARHEALHKLTTFFHSPQPEVPGHSSTALETNPVVVTEEAVHPPDQCSAEEKDFECPDAPILPPPDLYA